MNLCTYFIEIGAVESRKKLYKIQIQRTKRGGKLDHEQNCCCSGIVKSFFRYFKMYLLGSIHLTFHYYSEPWTGNQDYWFRVESRVTTQIDQDSNLFLQAIVIRFLQLFCDESSLILGNFTIQACDNRWKK